MKPLISILLAAVIIGCGHNHNPKPGKKDAAIVAYFHQQIATYGLDPKDLSAIREDLSRRKSPDRQSYLEHLTFAGRLLESKLSSLPSSNPKAEAYMKALGTEMSTSNFLQAQPQ